MSCPALHGTRDSFYTGRSRANSFRAWGAAGEGAGAAPSFLKVPMETLGFAVGQQSALGSMSLGNFGV